MSVYTAVEESEMREFLAGFAQGELVAFRGIREGIENTNYFVTTERGRWVLTLFEILPFEALPWYLELMACLAGEGVPVARPMASRSGEMLHRLKGKPAVLFERLAGASDLMPDARHCEALGAALGKTHRVAMDYRPLRQNDYGMAWMERLGGELAPFLPSDEAALLESELSWQAGLALRGLPRGVIHGDLFRDNVLFDGGRVSALLDWYNAGHDALLRDLAITLNDWCHREDGGLDPARTRALLQGYHRQRPLVTGEGEGLPAMLRAGALRFWLSRLRDRHFPREGALTFQKDPDWFRRMLELRRVEAKRVRHCLEAATGG